MTNTTIFIRRVPEACIFTCRYFEKILSSIICNRTHKIYSSPTQNTLESVFEIIGDSTVSSLSKFALLAATLRLERECSILRCLCDLMRYRTPHSFGRSFKLVHQLLNSTRKKFGSCIRSSDCIRVITTEESEGNESVQDGFFVSAELS